MTHPEQISEGQGPVPAGIEALYPVRPFSWLAPLWAYACGVIASSPAAGTAPSITNHPVGQTASGSASGRFAGSAVALLLGLLLAGPLLGTAWRAGRKIRSFRQLPADCLDNAPPKRVGAMPYTLRGSASDVLSSWLGTVSARWQRMAPELGTPLLRLVASSVFSLAVAAELGQRTLTIAAAGLLCVYARSARRACSAPFQVMDVFLPILLSWLIGHAMYGTLHAESILVAACFALALSGCSQVNKTGSGLLLLVLPQAAVVAYLVVSRQPVTATAVMILASSQLVWSPLLRMPSGRTRYFRAVQLPLAMTMLLAAFALR